jgi:hypothetical protein
MSYMNTVICALTTLCLIGIAMTEGQTSMPGYYNIETVTKPTSTITATCGGGCNCESPMASDAVISHSDVLEEYKDNLDCWWLLLGEDPRLRFTLFNTDSSSGEEGVGDPFLIAMCLNENCTRVATGDDVQRYAGYMTRDPAAPVQGDVTEYRTSFGISITFTSNDAYHYSGFRAYYDQKPVTVYTETECEANTYCVGDGFKIPCPIGTFSAPGSTQCESCLAGEYLSNSSSSTSKVFECTPCPAGTYSTTIGATSSSTCVQCAVNTYSTTVGAANSSLCLACPDDSTSRPASDPRMDCTCNYGFGNIDA